MLAIGKEKNYVIYISIKKQTVFAYLFMFSSEVPKSFFKLLPITEISNYLYNLILVL